MDVYAYFLSLLCEADSREKKKTFGLFTELNPSVLSTFYKVVYESLVIYRLS